MLISEIEAKGSFRQRIEFGDELGYERAEVWAEFREPTFLEATDSNELVVPKGSLKLLEVCLVDTNIESAPGKAATGTEFVSWLERRSGLCAKVLKAFNEALPLARLSAGNSGSQRSGSSASEPPGKR